MKWAVTPTTGTSEGREVRPSTNREGVSPPSKIRLPRLDMWLRFLDDSIPSKVEEALERPVGEGL